MSVLHTLRRLSKQFVLRIREHGLRSALAAARGYVERRLHPPPPPPPAPPPPAPSLKDIHTHFARIALDAFLASGARLKVPQFPRVDVSILLVLHNRAELTLACLNSILASQDVSYEIVVVDNASTDRSHQLLDRIEGARILRNETNVGFGAAVNQAALEARGEYVLLLNNDTQLLGNSLEAAVRHISADPGVGAVGAKIVLLDGSLQEAGSIIWQDGTALGYGRGDSPLSAPYMFRRDVDFCSGAFLLTPRRLFLRHGGFDPRYNPAYYEDVDYCAQLWRDGWRVVYDPDVALLHYESASSASPEAAQALMHQKRALFVEKHQSWLALKHPAAGGKVVAARTASSKRKRILLIDELIPFNSLGAGYPRANRLLHELRGMGHQVTLYPLFSRNEQWPAIYDELPRDLEVMLGYEVPRLREFLMERRGEYDLLFISRPTCMRAVRELFQQHPDLAKTANIVYDAEALFCLREAKQYELQGTPFTASVLQERIAEEVKLAEGCFSVVSVSPAEAKHFQRLGFQRVHILSHAVEAVPGDKPFADRQGLLFVGPIHHPQSPNGDSTRWLLEEVVPRLKGQVARPALTLAGMWCPDALPAGTDCSSARILGKVPDLWQIYNEARVFVAPTRFSAGIPLKAIEAAAHGVPMVATPLVAEQLNWRHERELLVADGPQEFARQCLRLHQDADLWQRLRDGALRAAQRECSREAFAKNLKHILDEAMDQHVPIGKGRLPIGRAA